MKIVRQPAKAQVEKTASTVPLESAPKPRKRQDGFGGGARAPDNRLEGRVSGHTVLPSRVSYEAWDVLGTLPPDERGRLSKPEQDMIKAVVGELKASVEEKGLSYVPVFGYLSLRTDNHRELGLPSQSDVVPGEHTVEATLEDHDIGVVASTIYRGTPEHPGVVAGLTAEQGASTPGTLLKLPVHRAEELLGHVFHREYFAEDDLTGDKPQAMYRPVLRDVRTADGETVKSLVFITNPDSAKDVNAEGKMTPGELAWFMGAAGGFRSSKGHFGGTSFAYWNSSYFGNDPVIREAIDRARYVPSPETIDWLSQNALTDERAMRALNVCLELFKGAALPLSLKAQQRPDQPLVREPKREPADVQAEVARFLELEAKLGLS